MIIIQFIEPDTQIALYAGLIKASQHKPRNQVLTAPALSTGALSSRQMGDVVFFRTQTMPQLATEHVWR